MSEDRSMGETLLILLVGAAAGVLIAPHTGRETRRRLRRWLEDAEENLKDEGSELWEKGKEVVKEKVKEAWEGLGR